MWPAVVQNQTRAFLTMILKPGELELSVMNLIYTLSAIDNIYNFKAIKILYASNIIVITK